jgi:class 3 adenylate cyclase/tetratricopeptide (TPR) repeat protein
MPLCPHCSAQNGDAVKFCGECGSPLAVSCSACGTPNEPGRKFCGECGAPLSPAHHAEPVPAEVAAGTPPDPAGRELRLVSVLFADLVGFTSLSEKRDAEGVRELLSDYFDTCRRVIERYGGTVQKFIGDAVMAVWGAPVAREDDAERAVRAALDLVQEVADLGRELEVPELRARAGVLTGEAAVMPGDSSEGLVVGDLVNTASRIQAEASPGTVLVGDTTRRASEQAVAFEEVGEHRLKGKAEPVRLYRALRVTAARGGALRSEGLEAPFVGRERELRLVKELYHASAEQSRAQLVQITGIAGIGKSRLTWEFFKYLDGLTEKIWWHRGRCLAYGEGVAYWALAEMVRTRAQILEGEDLESARRKLADSLAEHVPDAEEREWVGPRLANLLGLDDRSDTDRQDLFAAWRLFFERLADAAPVILVFEDLQWADQALVAFVEYLLEWSASQRLYVLALSRPELAELQPAFGRNVRNLTNLALEPLSTQEMTELLDGYVPGLPDDVKERVLTRAQGVPLYAVETVRMLLDRGLLLRDGPFYRPSGTIDTLEVPETLHALAAARLDGLPPEERQLVQQACVLGKTFTKQALAALTERPAADLEPLLAGLVRKEVLSLQGDARWPERGQYGFLQELLRQVAYETLSRRDRKSRHLAAVVALEQTFEGAEVDVPEVIATHLLAAIDSAPDDADVPEIRSRARDALAHAGERAAALAAPEEAQRYFDQAEALAAGDTLARAALLTRAGTLALHAGDAAGARQRLERAIALYEEADDPYAAARARVALADVDVSEGKLDEGTRRFESALATLEQTGPSAELAATCATLGRLQALRGDLEPAGPVLERALNLAESLVLDETLVQALTSKALILMHEGRAVEAELLFEGAVARARAAGLHNAWARAVVNLAVLLEASDRYADALALVDELETQAHQRGERDAIVSARLGSIFALTAVGRWQEALERLAEEMQAQGSRKALSERVMALPILCEQGRLAEAEALLREEEWQRDAEQADLAAAFAAVEARFLRAHDRPADALAAADRGLAHVELGLGNSGVKRCLVEALEASIALDDLERAESLLELVDALPPGRLTPWLRGQRDRFHARLDAIRGEHAPVERRLRRAEALFDELGLVFDLAVARVEHGEWLARQGRAEEAGPLLVAAGQTFEALEAMPWLERLRGIETPRAEVPA